MVNNSETDHVVYWTLASDGWICGDVGDYYPFTRAEMVALWNIGGVNVMKYWLGDEQRDSAISSETGEQ